MIEFINASIPLAHESLSREEVAEKLVKAAKIAGYEMDTDPMFGSLKSNKTHFLTRNDDTGSGFYSHRGKPNRQRLTLEQFEQHCQELAESRKAAEQPEPALIDPMRFEAAKAAMCGIISNDTSTHWNWPKIGEWSVKAADALISELKKQKQ